MFEMGIDLIFQDMEAPRQALKENLNSIRSQYEYSNRPKAEK